MTRRAPLWLALLLLAVAGCGEEEPAGAPLRTALRDLEPRIQALKIRSEAFAASLDVDPVALREERGMKGTKAFVELLRLYRDLGRNASPEQRTSYLAAVRRASHAISDPRYHGLADAPVERFREDVLSYLSAYLLLGDFGLERSRYRAEIDAIVPRIEQDLPNRGPSQRLAFVRHFEALGLPAPDHIDAILPQTLFRRRVPATQLRHMDQYLLTHEIYALTDHGRIPASQVFTRDDIEYFDAVLPVLLESAIERGDVDLAAEIVVSYPMLGRAGEPAYLEGLEFLVDSQNPNGSFGNWEGIRALAAAKKPRYDVDVGFYLHTTEVVIWALAGAESILLEAPAQP